MITAAQPHLSAARRHDGDRNCREPTHTRSFEILADVFSKTDCDVIQMAADERISSAPPGLAISLWRRLVRVQGPRPLQSERQEALRRLAFKLKNYSLDRAEIEMRDAIVLGFSTKQISRIVDYFGERPTW